METANDNSSRKGAFYNGDRLCAIDEHGVIHELSMKKVLSHFLTDEEAKTPETAHTATLALMRGLIADTKAATSNLSEQQALARQYRLWYADQAVKACGVGDLSMDLRLAAAA